MEVIGMSKKNRNFKSRSRALILGRRWSRLIGARWFGAFVCFCLVLVTACVSSPDRDPSNFQNGLIRGLASTNDPHEREVVAHLPDHSRVSLPPMSLRLYPERDLNAPEIDSLIAYLVEHRGTLGAGGDIGFALRFESQRRIRGRLFVRFSQSVQRRLVAGGKKVDYSLPIQGADVVAMISDRGLVRLNSHLLSPVTLGRSLDELLRQSGFVFDFTDSELAEFIWHIKTDSAAAARLRRYFARVGAKRGIAFSFDEFLVRRLPEQRMQLNRFFGSLGRLATARILVDLALRGEVALVRYQSQWMFQVSDFFGLPLQFDVVSSTKPGAPLSLKNLREMHIPIVDVRSFESPHFPGGTKLQGTFRSDLAADRMKTVVDYFSSVYGWKSYRGPDVDQTVSIYSGLKSVDYRENAAWLGKTERFVVGEGGEKLRDLESSHSVLGHEYMHAILQFSSGLGYGGDAGAINEHLADIFGVGADRFARQMPDFSYRVGGEVLQDEVLREQRKLIALAIEQHGYSAKEVREFQLETPALRQLFAPGLSLAAQFSSLDQARRQYPESCQPSLDNDNCGIHFVSGVLNRAAALIIRQLGVEETLQIYFVTAVSRLNSATTLSEFVEQLHEECVEHSSVASQCSVIWDSFAKVGVRDAHSSQPQGKAKQEPAAAVDAQLGQMLAPKATTYAASPLLKFCGRIQRLDSDRTVVFDDHHNATMIRQNYPIKTIGYNQELRAGQCACVMGHVTQVSDHRGKLFNAFLDVHGTEDFAGTCPAELEKNSATPVADIRHETVCGWLSVDSKTRDTQLIDNRSNPLIAWKLIASGKKKKLKELWRSQCACVSGETRPIESPTGTATAREFVDFDVRSLKPEKSDRCIGIKWQ